MKNRIAPMLVAAGLLSACASTFETTTALTPEEWIHHFKRSSFQSTPLMGTQESTVNRPLAQVLADASEYSGKCFNGKIVKKSGWLGNQSYATTQIYTSGMSKSASGMNSLYLQVKDQGHYFPGMPKDGYFMFAAEISGDGKQTKIVSYHLLKAKGFSVSLQDWANGKKDSCPELL